MSSPPPPPVSWIAAPGTALEGLVATLSAEAFVHRVDRGDDTWTRGETHVRATLDRDLDVLGIEVLGPDAPALARSLGAGLGAWTEEDLHRLLASGEPATRRRGIAAGVASHAFAVLPLLVRLRQDPHPRIASEAEAAALLLLPGAASAALDPSPGDPAGFGAAVREAFHRELPAIRRQVLRSLRPEDARGELAVRVVRDALADEDWETRATATLVAARLGLAGLAKAIGEVAVPTTGREGLTRAEREALAALRSLAEIAMNGGLTAWQDMYSPKSPERVARLRRALLGEPGPVDDALTLLATTLTHPLPQEALMSPALHRLPGTELDFVRVSGVPHLLGYPASGRPAEWVTPLPFLIARSPDAARSFDDAQAFALSLGSRAGVSMRLPTVVEWEAAARGPDGRLRPWGIGLIGSIDGASPWGLLGAVGRGGEWAIDATGGPAVVGSARDCRVHGHREGRPGELAATRLLWET